MKVLLIAGEVGPRLVEFFLKKNSLLDVEAEVDFNDAIEKLSERGFVYDKVVVYSIALAGDVNQAFEALSSVVVGMPENRKLVIVDRESGLEDLIPAYFLNVPNIEYHKDIAKAGAMYNIISDKHVDEAAYIDRAQQMIPETELPPLEFEQTANGMYRDADGYEYAPSDVGYGDSPEAMAPIEEPAERKRIFGKLFGRKSEKTMAPAEEPMAPIEVDADAEPAKQGVPDYTDKFVSKPVEPQEVVSEPQPEVVVAATPPEKFIEHRLPQRPKVLERAGSNTVGLQEMTSRDAKFAIGKRNKVIVFTGQGRTGVTSTVCNLAFTAATAGMRTLVIDLDIEFRTVDLLMRANSNLHSQQFSGLLNACAGPGRLKSSVAEIFDNVDTLGISIESDYVEPEAVDPQKLSDVVMEAVTLYDLVLIDLPYNQLGRYWQTIAYSTSVINVMPNDMQGLLKFVMLLDQHYFGDFSKFQLFCSKLSILFNMALGSYTCNGSQINAKTFSKLVHSYSEDCPIEDFRVVGSIPWEKAFGEQASTGSLIAMDSQWNEVYMEILKVISFL